MTSLHLIHYDVPAHSFPVTRTTSGFVQSLSSLEKVLSPDASRASWRLYNGSKAANAHTRAMENVRQVESRLPRYTSVPSDVVNCHIDGVSAPVISFRVYNRHIVVLNSAEAMSDLLERKADIYSDRPMSWMYNVICDRGKAIFNISSSDPRHKQYRKLLQTGLGIRAIRGYLPLIQRESRRLAQGLLQTPDEFITHVQR